MSHPSIIFRDPSLILTMSLGEILDYIFHTFRSDTIGTSVFNIAFSFLESLTQFSTLFHINIIWNSILPVKEFILSDPEENDIFSQTIQL